VHASTVRDESQSIIFTIKDNILDGYLGSIETAWLHKVDPVALAKSFIGLLPSKLPFHGIGAMAGMSLSQCLAVRFSAFR